MSQLIPVRWIASDGVTILEGRYVASDTGKLTLREWKGATMRMDEPVRSPSPRPGCRQCGSKDAFVWLGIRWHGTPFPLRWWRWLRGTDTPADWSECGCIVKLKAAILAVRAGIIAVRRA
jgi:hypothetical protein